MPDIFDLIAQDSQSGAVMPPPDGGDIFDKLAASRAPSKPKAPVSENIKNAIREGVNGGFMKGFVLPTLKAVPRVSGTIAGQLAAAPGAGVEAAGKLLPRIPTDPDRPIYKLEAGSLDEAQDTLDKRLGALNFITTPEEAEGIENIGLAMKPFEMSGQGLGAIAELAATGDLDKAADVARGESAGSSIFVPIAKTTGEASAMFGFGGKGFKKLKGRFGQVKEGLSAKNLERLHMAQEAKYGRTGTVPKEITAPMTAPPAPVRPMSVESKVIKDQFSERFLENPHQKDISELYDYAMTDKTNKQKQVKYRAVDETEAAFLKEKTGLNVSGYEHTIDNYSIKHILSEHGNKNIEVKRGQLPVTKGDISLLPEIIKTPDHIEYAGKTKIGRDGIRYQKRINGEVYVVEEVRTGKNTLSATTMYKKAAAPDASPPGKPPAQTSETFRGKDVNILDDAAAQVKGKDKGTTLYSGLPLKELGELYTKNIGEPIWDKGIMELVPKLLEKVPGGKAVNRALIYDYRYNLPKKTEFLSRMEDMKRYQTIGREYAIDLGKRIQAHPEHRQMAMGEYIRGEKAGLAKNELALADEAKNAMLDLGRQAVDAGLLSEETFFKNAGRYMPRLYTSKEYQSLLNQFGISKPNRLDLSRFRQRKDIPKEIRQEMGEILTPGYPIAKGITQLTHDIEMAKFFNGVASNPEWAVTKGMKDAVIPDGWKKIESKKLGKLDGAYVHPEIFADLNEAVHVMKTGEKVWRRTLGAWKFGKVIVSPKTHARNLMSNSVLAHLGGMPMYEQPVYLVKAASELKNQGYTWKAARQEGLLTNTFTNAELRELFNQVEGQMGGIKAGGIPEQMGIMGSIWDKARIAGNKAAKLYEAEEQWFKMAKFIHNVERKGMDFKVAAMDAEKWLFNYSKVTKFQDKYRSKWYGAPFATFTFKALPRIAEAAVKTPWRFALPGAIIYGMEKAAQVAIGDTDEEKKAKKELRPDYMKGSFLGIPNFARVPIVDEDGREYYLNLTYILPWGDIAEQGGFGPIPGGLMPFSQPFVKEPVQQALNHDAFWEEPIVKDEDVVGKDVFDSLATKAKIRGKHVVQTMAPTPVMDISKIVAALKNEPDYRGRTRPKGVIAADVLAGIKMYPVDYAEQAAREIAKIHPETGYQARKIYAEIRTLSMKKQAIEKKGGNAKDYEEQIAEKIQQLQGLAKEAKELGKTFKKIKR